MSERIKLNKDQFGPDRKLVHANDHFISNDVAIIYSNTGNIASFSNIVKQSQSLIYRPKHITSSNQRDSQMTFIGKWSDSFMHPSVDR